MSFTDRCYFTELSERLRDAHAHSNQYELLELLIHHLLRIMMVPCTDAEILHQHDALLETEDAIELAEYCDNVRRHGQHLRDRPGDLWGLTAWIATNKLHTEVATELSRCPMVYYDDIQMVSDDIDMAEVEHRVFDTIRRLNQMRFVRRSSCAF